MICRMSINQTKILNFFNNIKMSLINYNIRIRKEKKSKTQHLYFEGEIGINTIDQIKTRIEAIHFESDQVFVTLKNITSFDLSAVQLLYSLRKSLSYASKKVKIASDMPGNISVILRNTGFEDII